MSINRRTIWLTLIASCVLPASISRAQWHDITPQYGNQIGPRYAYGNAQYSAPNPGATRPHTPFGPVSFDHDYQPFAPADISEFGNGPHRRYGFYASYERLYWSITRPPTATVGSDRAEDVTYWEETDTPPQLQERFYQNSFTTGVFNGDFGWGNRYDLGYTDMDNTGWLVSILSNLSQNQTINNIEGIILFDDPFDFLSNYTDIDDDGIDDDRNANGIFGRFGDAVGPVFPPDAGDQNISDVGDRIRFLPRYDEVRYTNRIELNGVELMRTGRIPRFHDGSDFELLLGVRYLQVKDRMTLLGIGGVLDSTFMNTTIENNIVGPQVGFRWSVQRQRWVMSAEGRFMAGFNFQNGTQYWVVASEIEQIPIQNAPSIAHYSVRNSATDEIFAPLGELRIQTSYYLTKAVALKLGYTLLYVDGIQRAADSVVYELPNFGITQENNNHSLISNGVSFGIEINR